MAQAAPAADGRASRAVPEAVEVEPVRDETRPPGTEWHEPLQPEFADYCRATGATAEALVDLMGAVELIDIKQTAARYIAALRWSSAAARALDPTVDHNIDEWEAIYAEIEAAETPAEMTLVLERYGSLVETLVVDYMQVSWWSQHCVSVV